MLLKPESLPNPFNHLSTERCCKDIAATVNKMAPPATTDQPDIVYPKGLKLALIIVSAFIGLFLVSLVRQFLLGAR